VVATLFGLSFATSYAALESDPPPNPGRFRPPPLPGDRPPTRATPSTVKSHQTSAVLWPCDADGASRLLPRREVVVAGTAVQLTALGALDNLEPRPHMAPTCDFANGMAITSGATPRWSTPFRATNGATPSHRRSRGQREAHHLEGRSRG
jgi:hypothetical protein